MLGYMNRYLGIATVIRNFKKDYDSDYIHTDIIKQLDILKRRIDLSRLMLSVSAAALMLACLSMFTIFLDLQLSGKTAFGLSLVAMIVSVVLSLYETTLSNKSLFIEIEDMVAKEKTKK